MATDDVPTVRPFIQSDFDEIAVVYIHKQFKMKAFKKMSEYRFYALLEHFKLLKMFPLLCLVMTAIFHDRMLD